MDLGNTIIAAISCAAVGVVSIIIGIILIFFRHKVAEPENKNRMFLWPLTIGSLLLVVAASFSAPEQPNWLIAFYIILVGALLVVFLGTLIRTTYILWSGAEYDRMEEEMVAPGAPPAGLAPQPVGLSIRLSKFWNMEKSFGGSVFGDVANTVGIVSGLGAYHLFQSLKGFFWLGQFGALLGILVGLSLALRWMLGTFRYIQSNTLADRWLAPAGLLISCLTLLAMMAPIPESGEISANWYLSGVQLGILGLSFLILLFLMGWYYRVAWRANRRVGGLGLINWILVLLITGGSLVVIVLYQTVLQNVPKSVPEILGLVALFFSIIVEAGVLYMNRNDPKKLKIVRSILIMIGNVAMGILLVIIAATNPNQDEFLPIFLFVTGLSLPLVAAGFGIDLGMQSLG